MMHALSPALAAAVLLAAGPAYAGEDKPSVVMVAGKPMPVSVYLERAMAGGPIMDPVDLDAAIAEAENHPLGSDRNPVRVEGPTGERSYLARLRCADGRSPRFSRTGNLGPGIYMTIIDNYELECGSSDPGRVSVKMDMYFKGHVEDRPVPGFTIVPGTAGPQ